MESSSGSVNPDTTRASASQDRPHGGTRALFLVDDISRYGGVRTRVTEELSCLAGAEDISQFVIARCNLRNIEAVGRAIPSLREETGAARMRGIAIPKVPHAGVPILYELSFLANTALMLMVSLPVVIGKRVNLIYGHNNEQGSLAVLLSRLLGVPTVADIHGVEVDEYLEKYPSWSGHRGRIRFWRKVEAFVASRADTAVCVSAPHLEEIRRRARRRDDAVVLPCFADEKTFQCSTGRRDDLRSSLGIGPGEAVFVYSGIVHPRYDEFNPIRFFASLGNRDSCRLLVLAADPESVDRVQKLCPPEVKGRVVCVSVPRATVPEYLCASDIAILLRRRSVVNRVASPTKFSEYLLCGLPVVISDEIGDASALVRSEGIGVVLTEESLIAGDLRIDSAKLATPEVRSRARAAGLAHLSRGRCAPRFLAIVRGTAHRRRAG